MPTTNDIILHNYPQSPVAEKIRVALGIKGLAWHDVEIPRLPPKPKLTELTGGYRRTPVMQIGADIYCDSQCIIAELDRRHPTPSLAPTADAGLMSCLSRWADGDLFDLSVKIVLGSAGEDLPKDFAEDRGRLYLGENWVEGLKAANQQLPHLVSQMRAPLSWANDQLSDERPFLTGTAPAEIDAQLYHVTWFIRGRWAGGPTLLSEFPHLQRWEKSVEALGHGTSNPMDADDAIDVATKNDPLASIGVAPNDPQGLKLGMQVSVTPDVDGGEQPVVGELYNADAHKVTVKRQSETCGIVCVHFPRYGYRISRID